MTFSSYLSALQSVLNNPRVDHQVVLHSASQQQWLRFTQPVKIIAANSIEEVLPKLQEVNQLVQEQHLWAAGFLSYEAAAAFDSILRTYQIADFPLLWFGLYEQPKVIELAEPTTRFELDWRSTITKEQYDSAIAKIKHYISCGDTYQVNYTTRLEADFTGDPWQYFLSLVAAQQANYGAYLELPDFTICSASPELFFTLDSSEIVSRPMKGTAARGYTLKSDRALAQWLQSSAKNQAENVMIVDMIRNDLSRIAQLGTVEVSSLFDVERYPTLWQMTSTVKAQTEAALPEIMQALFPCASITGAPKASTMQIIQELEPTPRKIYTGTIGYITPQSQAQFNVAIRTVLLDRVNQKAEYGVGGGIVWDSASASEYEECQIKARVLLSKTQPFDLLETLLWKPDRGYFLLDYHLQRLQDSANYFGYLLDLALVQKQLTLVANKLHDCTHKVRLLVNQQGQITIEPTPFELTPQVVKLAIADKPIDINNPFFYHKTTNRQLYEGIKQAHPDCDDVILWNERQEITETCIYNLVVQKDGKLLTPPVECGLLAGTMRAYLLEQEKIEEAVIKLADLSQCEAIYLVNSVRQWQQGTITQN